MIATWRAALTGALLAAAMPAAAQDYAARVARVLKATPLIDGHNDWPEALREHEGDARWTLDLRRGLDKQAGAYNTDIARLRAGLVGGQFWSVWVDPNLPGPEQVKQTLEQIDLVHAIVARYPNAFVLARTAADVRRIHAGGRIASLIGVEGGGQIDNSLAVLRAYRDLGAGYLTLTHALTLPWADSATDDPKHDGLTPFGEDVVRELNRLGMLVDLSHVSPATMKAALAVTRAPVIFSHSGARAIDDHPRDVPDDVLALVRANRGVVMANFYPPFVSQARFAWTAERAAEKARLAALHPQDAVAAATGLAAWEQAHPAPAVTVAMVADHIEHIARVCGHDCVGIGSDYDGIDVTPEGLSDVASYPRLFEELARRGWSDADLAKLSGGNVLRAMREAEAVARRLAGEAPSEAAIDAPVSR